MIRGSWGKAKTYHLYGEKIRSRVESTMRLLFKRLTIGVMALVLSLGGLSTIIVSRVLASPPLVLGELPYQKLISYPLTPTSAILVNAANGNMVLQTQDLTIQGTLLPLSITRYYNSMATGSGQAGDRDSLSIGPDVHITSNSNGSATYKGPSGFSVTYPSNGSGGYTTPSTYTAASLSTVSGGGWKLQFNQSNESYTFNASGNLIKDSLNTGQNISYSYNSNGTLASVTDTQGRVTTFTNYTGNNVGTITDPTGRTVTYHYVNGQLWSANLPQSSWGFNYDGNGLLNQVRTPAGASASMTYDSSNRIKTLQFVPSTSGFHTYTYTYNSNNTVVNDPNNHNTTYNYDGSGRVTSIVDADGNTQSSSWDGNNNLSTSTDPSNTTMTMGYDSLNNLTSVQNPNLSGGASGAQQSYTYNNSAHPYSVSSEKDTQGNQKAYSYNAYGNVQSTANSASGGSAMGTVSKAYQGDPIGTGGTVNCGGQTGEVCSSTDAKGNVTNYGYDTKGNLTSIAAPSPLGSQTIGYDALSRPTSIKNGNGVTESIAYNDRDLPTKITIPSGTINYDYDQNGNLSNINNYTGGSISTVYSHDGFTRTTRVTSPNSDVNYVYDNAGNLISESGTGGGTTAYTYDPANLLTNINNSSTGYNQSFSYTHGRVTGTTLPGGISETIGYDQAGRETSVKATKGTAVLTDYSGTYTSSSGLDTGLLQSETNNVTGVTTTYAYDGLNRLLSSTQSGSGTLNSYTYTYDANGNITQTSHNGAASPVFGYNAADELTTVNGASAGSFDADGNQTTTRTGMTMSYNSIDQTNSITPSGGTAQNMKYASDGQTVRINDGSIAQADGLFGLFMDSANNGALNTYYTHMPTGTGQVLGETIGSTPYYYLFDLHGSVVTATDGSGAVKATYAYDPYGNLLSSSGTLTNPFRYSDGYFDATTGLYKFGARYYNPGDGRWTQLDPAGQNPGYAYAGDDPINNIDPSGTFSLKGILSSAFKGCVGSLGVLAGYATAATVATGGAAALPSWGAVGLSCLGGAATGVAVHALGGEGHSTDYMYDHYKTLQEYLR